MNPEWNAEGSQWPGARWWRIDLHAHSSASYDFDKDDKDWKGWLEAVRDAGIHAVAVTDHNTAEGIAPLQEALAQVENPPTLFPGVELTAEDGTHLLLVFDAACSQADIEAFLVMAQVRFERNNQKEARSALTVEQILDNLAAANRIIIAAHVNGPDGLLCRDNDGSLRRDGIRLIRELSHRNLAAVEINPREEGDFSWLDGSKSQMDGRVISQLWCSDSHAFKDAGRRFTWVKMTRPDIEGLRLALLDGAESLQLASVGGKEDPNSRAHCLIESMVVGEAKYMGRSAAFTVSFNPWFNAIIGGRGTGKSTLLDLTRKAFRRDEELSGDLAAEFKNRMRVPPKRGTEGLLTEQTSVEVTYRKDGERFVLSWNQEGVAEPIVRIEADEAGERRVPEAGDIRERFPVRIYSQKQLFDHARNPNTLLKLIDEAEAVGGAVLERERQEAENQYLSLCAEMRSLRVRAADLPTRVANLEDVRRKIAIVEKVGNAEVRREYALRRRQNAAWFSIKGSVEEGIVGLERATDALVVADLDASGGDMEEPAFTILRRMHAGMEEVVGKLRAAVRDAVARAGASLTAISDEEDNERWSSVVAECERRYEDLRKQLEESGIVNPNEHDLLLQRAVTLEEEIRTLEQRRTEAEEREREALRALERYRELRGRLIRKRSAFVEDASNDLIRVKVQAYADRESCTSSLRETLGIDRFEREYEELSMLIGLNFTDVPTSVLGEFSSPGAVNPISMELSKKISPMVSGDWSYGVLDFVVKELRALLADPQKKPPFFIRDRRFETALRRLAPEKLDRLALYAPDDAVEVSFQDTRDGSWRPLAQGSPGQQTAALLAFVLGYGDEPIFLDQPEDDLDSTIIYELLVQRLRAVKKTRQVIVVTHNPNIVVHGDAEYVVSLKAEHGQTKIRVKGGLQERETREEICRVMEGGHKAFEERYRRIAHSGMQA